MNKFIDFLNNSPSPFHAVDNVKKILFAHGFTELFEATPWNITHGKGYFVTRNQSAIIAFYVGKDYTQGNPIAMIGAHTDSPCLKVKPVSRKTKAGYDCVGVETYGGGLWHTWFDRDLSMAGRVYYQAKDGIKNKLVDLKSPLLRIPTLAIHLDRSVSESFKFNNENQLLPLLQMADATLNKQDKHHGSLLSLLKTECEAQEILDLELCLYDTQKAVIGGIKQEFLFSARLDNLCMSYCAISSLVQSIDSTLKTNKADSHIRLVGLFDNEEVGSETAHGANSNFLESLVHRLLDSPTTAGIACANSFLLSADMAHAIHPNYADKHEENLAPLLNKGIVIKENANQRYATTSKSSLFLRQVALAAKVPVQDFAVRNDSPCGSTIGPMVSSRLGITTVDLGIPQLSMHSIREQCGVQDVENAIGLFSTYFEDYSELIQVLK
jgi:aspartyl aminopeptidase